MRLAPAFVFTAIIWASCYSAAAADSCGNVAALESTGLVGFTADAKAGNGVLIAHTFVGSYKTIEDLLQNNSVTTDDATILFVKSINPQIDDFTKLSPGQNVWVPSWNKQYVVDKEFSVEKFAQNMDKLLPTQGTSLAQVQGGLEEMQRIDPANNQFWAQAQDLATDKLDVIMQKPEGNDLLAFDAYAGAIEKLGLVGGSIEAAKVDPESAGRKEKADLVVATLNGVAKETTGNYRQPVAVLVRSIDATSLQPKPGYQVFYATGYAHELGCADKAKHEFPALTESEQLMRRGVYWLWVEHDNNKTDPKQVDLSLTNDNKMKVDIVVPW